ncbi:MAG TPA: ArsA-related P-loop ATPase, partial [Thermoanaerobaculia bacterium]|nr:ArsA-related P-loop ATPase [Thermoanaerobaculia bacterium]
DALVRRYAPDPAAVKRILENRFYQHLAGNLAGVLEYMAVERLFEVANEGDYDRVILDTPPTRQALDFLEAPERIVAFLDSGALRIALKPWFSPDGARTLVMTFDPSRRLKDALDVGSEATARPVPVPLAGARLDASLLDARRTFDRLVERYAPDAEARRRILANRFYQHLAGTLSGVLEYMAVERLFEVAREGRYDQVILDTPPTRQALDFLEAPSRIVRFLDSGALKLALRDWFDERGRLQPGRGLGLFGRRLEGLLDRVVGLDFLRDMLEFFQAFGPLFDGFRGRARKVEDLLASERTRFLLVAGPGEERIPDTLFFARRLREAGHRLGPLVVNRVHPAFPELERPRDGRTPEECAASGPELFAWLGAQDRRGVEELRHLVAGSQPVVPLPLQPEEPTTLAALEALGAELLDRLEAG